MKKYLTTFQNVKFNVWLFAVLATASVLGTLIPQIPENPEKVQQFIAASPKWGAVLKAAGVFNLYYSWWFIGLLGLMAFDVIVCKLIFGKFPGFSTFRSGEKDPAQIQSQKLKAEYVSSRSQDSETGAAAALLKRTHYRVEERRLPDGSVLLMGARHRLQRYGSWVSHISIVLILLSNLTGALYGFREVLNIVEGGTEKMQNRPWAVTCDKFTLEWYEGNATPKTFASDLRLFIKGRQKAEQKIVVNEPLEFEKVRFYQATYGPYLKEARVGIFRRDHPEKSPTLTLRPGEESAIPGTEYSVRVLEFTPDFEFNEKKEPSTRSAQLVNPAIQLLISKNGKPVRAPWIFEHLPGMQMPPLDHDDEFIPILAEYVPSFYTGLQITYDPGADLFWLACAILVVGLGCLFYMHHRKVWVWIKPSQGGGSSVQVGGYSSRGKLSYEAEFLKLVRGLKPEESLR